MTELADALHQAAGGGGRDFSHSAWREPSAAAIAALAGKIVKFLEAVDPDRTVAELLRELEVERAAGRE